MTFRSRQENNHMTLVDEARDGDLTGDPLFHRPHAARNHVAPGLVKVQQQGACNPIVLYRTPYCLI